MQITGSVRRKIFKYAGALGLLGFLGLIEPVGYVFFIFFTFFLYADECMEPEVKDEMYQKNSLKAYKVTAILAISLCVFMLNAFVRTNDISLIKQIFIIGTLIVWSSYSIVLYYCEKKLRV